jgi:hypothetical protein
LHQSILGIMRALSRITLRPDAAAFLQDLAKLIETEPQSLTL